MFKTKLGDITIGGVIMTTLFVGGIYTLLTDEWLFQKQIDNVSRLIEEKKKRKERNKRP